uniref:Capsid protein n=1 Tax=Xiangshan picorna-like virus 6 TaxID=2886222 RepID=A0A8K1YQP0_9VIRU|nr:MAG: hypothetical protein [Xiangshan picorna-like virus 6]
MNAEEPIGVINDNVPAGSLAHKIPEQARIAVCNMPRQISMMNLMYQWQPMGFRIVIDLPFVSNDESYLFAIRNGPFIPLFPYKYDDTNNATEDENFKTTGDPNPKVLSKGIDCFAWNNTRPVVHFQTFEELTASAKFPDKYGIKISQFDAPPFLSALSQMFRRWRGDMQYRIRTVAGFATQGYVIVSSLKNIPSPIWCGNPFLYRPSYIRQDTSFRESMMNAYVMTDTSMFRHVEVTQQFEYPVQWYDQFMWLARRVSPLSAANVTNGPQFWSMSEPHGDNYVVVASRGSIAAAHTGAQLVFELEYRAVEGFQFADPFLPNQAMFQSFGQSEINPLNPIARPIITVPDPTRTGEGRNCNGISFSAKSDDPFPPSTLMEVISNRMRKMPVLSPRMASPDEIHQNRSMQPHGNRMPHHHAQHPAQHARHAREQEFD